MININEFRIGNIIQRENKKSGKIDLIKLSADNIRDLNNSLVDDFYYKYHIPSSVFLSKYGFEKGINDSDLRIQINKDVSMSIWLCSKIDNCLIGDEIVLTKTYFHEIQNLYFDLTGRELQYVA